jgi:ribosomal protein L29
MREMSNEDLNEKSNLLKNNYSICAVKAVGQLEHGEDILRVRKDIAKPKPFSANANSIK